MEMSELIKVRIDGAAPVPLTELVELWRAQNPAKTETPPPDAVTKEEEAIETSEDAVTEMEEGRVLMVGEGAANGYDGPVVMDVALIKPGFGNTKDNHYYPRKTLEAAAPLFVGKKMYLTNHVDDEHNMRTEVSEILACPVRFTEDGAPVARVGVFDPIFAANVRNRSKLGTLNHLHCSINGTGRVKKDAIEEGGRKGHLVEEITLVKTFDWVPQAGAGGQALNLVEMEGDEMNETGEKDKDVKETDEKEELVIEAIQEEEAPVALDSSVVLPILMEAGLPEKTVKRLAAKQWFDVADVTASVAEMQELMTDVKEAGRVRNLGQSSSEQPKAEALDPEKLREAQIAVARKYGMVN